MDWFDVWQVSRFEKLFGISAIGNEKWYAVNNSSRKYLMTETCAQK